MGGFGSPTYRAWLKNSVGTLQSKNLDLLDAIKRLQCRVATTNYDELLRKRLGAVPRTWRNPEAVAEFLSGQRKDVVWHIHGVWDEPEFSDLLPR